jgi:hypothetical protein
MTRLTSILRSYLLFGRAPRPSVTIKPRFDEARSDGQPQSRGSDPRDSPDGKDEEDRRAEISLLFDVIPHT